MTVSVVSEFKGLVSTVETTAINGGTNVSTAGIYIFSLDSSGMVDGDQTTLKIYGKVSTAATMQVIYSAAFANKQAEPLKISIATPTPFFFLPTIQCNTPGVTFSAATWAL